MDRTSHFKRPLVLAYLRAHPWRTYTEVAKATGLEPERDTTRTLHTLARAGLVISDGGRPKRYATTSAGFDYLREAEPMLRQVLTYLDQPSAQAAPPRSVIRAEAQRAVKGYGGQVRKLPRGPDEYAKGMPSRYTPVDDDLVREAWRRCRTRKEMVQRTGLHYDVLAYAVHRLGLMRSKTPVPEKLWPQLRTLYSERWSLQQIADRLSPMADRSLTSDEIYKAAVGLGLWRD